MISERLKGKSGANPALSP